MAITVPFTFVDGTAAKASEVNANFAAIITKAFDKTGDIMTGTLSVPGVTITGTGASALSVGGGIIAGTGAVGIVDTTGKIPALTATYIANLSGTALTGVELSLGNPAVTGYILTSTTGGVRSWAASGTPSAHQLDGIVHTVSGLTTGHFLKATGATSFAFGAHGLTYSDVGADASGAATTATSNHAALTTGVHGLAITAGQTLTVTSGGIIGSAAYTASTAYDASGAASTVQTNLGTHAGLTTTAHGLGASAFHADSYFEKALGNPAATGYILSSTDAGVRSWVSSGTPSAHQLDGIVHTVSGLTTGHFLKATGATTFGFAAHGLTYSDVGAAASSHNHAGTDINSGTVADARLSANVPLLNAANVFTAFGTHTWSASGNGYNFLTIGNSSTGNAAAASISASNNLGNEVRLTMYGGGFSSTGSAYADGARIYAGGANGLSIHASHNVRIYSEDALAATWGASGALTNVGTINGLTIAAGAISGATTYSGSGTISTTNGYINTVVTGASATSAYIDATHTGYIGAVLQLRATRAASSAYNFVDFSANGVSQFQINGVGSVITGTWNAGAVTTASEAVIPLNAKSAALYQARFGIDATNGIYFYGAQSATKNWLISTDYISASTFELTPSTANSGSTFTTPVFKLTTTGAATFASTLTTGSSAYVGTGTTAEQGVHINAATYPVIRYQLGGSNRWATWVGNAAMNDWSLYSYGTSTDVLKFAYSTGAATFAAGVTGASFTSSTGGFFHRSINAGTETATETTIVTTGNGDNKRAGLYAYNTYGSDLLTYINLKTTNAAGTLATVVEFRDSGTTFAAGVSATNYEIVYPSAGVALQGYVAGNLRIAAAGSGSSGGARGGLIASTGDFSGGVSATTFTGVSTSLVQGKFSGYSRVGGARVAAGSIQLGNTAAAAGFLDYDDSGQTVLYLDNSYDGASAQTMFRLRTAGTPVTAVTLGTTGTTIGGTLTVNGFGTHELSSSGTGANVLKVRNTADGTGNYSAFWLANDAANLLQMYAFASSFTHTGDAYGAGVAIDAVGTGGLSIAATHASGAIRFYTGGTTKQWEITSGGTLLGAGKNIGDNPAGSGVIGKIWATSLNLDNPGTGTGTVLIRDIVGGVMEQTSSARFKDVGDKWSVSTKQLQEFINLTPKLWDYKDQKTNTAGFISEDLDALPIKVNGVSPMVNYDIDGLPRSNKDFAIVAMQHLVLQDHEARIAALEAELKALKGN